MKKLTTYIALALLGIVMLGTSAKAQATANLGDLILGFQTTATTNGGNNVNLEVDLGAYTNFTGLANGTTVNLTEGLTTGGQTGAFNISDLTTDYGTSATTLKLSVSGVISGSSTDELFVSQKGSTSANAPGEVPDNSVPYNGIKLMPNTFDSGTAGATGSTENTITKANAGSYTSEAGSTGTYGAFPSSTTQQTYSAGSSVTFALFDVNQDPTSTLTAPEVGYFTLYGNSASSLAGQLTFTSTESVPEPSSYLLGAAGLLLLAVFRRRMTLRA